MKKEIIENLKIVAAGILFGGAAIFFVNKYIDEDEKRIESLTELSYDDESNEMKGVLSYEEVSQNIKIVTLEENGTQFEEVMYVYEKDELHPLSKRYAFKYQTFYIRLEDGWEMVSFDYAGKEEQQNKTPIRTYGTLRIVKEENFMNYLLEHLGLKEEYDVSEILEAYDEKVLLEEAENKKEVKTYGKKN